MLRRDMEGVIAQLKPGEFVVVRSPAFTRKWRVEWNKIPRRFKRHRVSTRFLQGLSHTQGGRGLPQSKALRASARRQVIPHSAPPEIQIEKVFWRAHPLTKWRPQIPTKAGPLAAIHPIGSF